MELIQARYPIEKIVATQEFFQEYAAILSTYDVLIAKPSQLDTLGTFKSNNATLAIAKIVQPKEPVWKDISYALVLENVNDPGNFGTLIRIADWYGINTIVASPDTVELYNPKVISASKGSFLRVKVYYEALDIIFKKVRRPVIGTYMEGISVHQYKWPEQGFIILGNEANGISDHLRSFISERITIPGPGNAESLNVAISGAIVVDNWSRSRNVD